MSGNNKNSNNTSTIIKCGFVEQLVFVVALICGTACSICGKIMFQMDVGNVDNNNGHPSSSSPEKFEKPIFQTFGMFLGMVAGLLMHWIVLVFQIPFPGYSHNNKMGPPTTSTTPGTATSAVSSHNKQGQQQHQPRTEPTTPETPVVTSGKAAEAAAAVTEKDLLLDNKKAKALYYSSNNGNRSEEESPLLPRRLLVVNNSSPPPAITPSSYYLSSTYWMYLMLAVPSIFDLTATALATIGLVYLDVSIYQLLRGSGIVFVALLKHYGLHDRLYQFQWVGVLLNVVSVVLVGSTALLNSLTSSAFAAANADDTTATTTKRTIQEATIGCVLVLLGAFVQALQFVFEERVMTPLEDDNESSSAVPPLLLIGMEGFWGALLCLAVVYPIAYYLPGNDNGSYEDPFRTWQILTNTPSILYASLVYLFAILGYNLFAVLTTFLLNSIWHAILENFRPITVWGTDMFIFYVITTSNNFGEPWTMYSWVQLVGMFVLLYGTAIYNAPNAGSIELRGKWYHMFLNFSREYERIDFDNKSWRCTSSSSSLVLQHHQTSSSYHNSILGSIHSHHR